MNAPAIPQAYPAPKPEYFLRLSLKPGSKSNQTIQSILRNHHYPVLADLSHLSDKNNCCLLLESKINALKILPFSKWLLKKAGLESLSTKLENANGDVVAECKLYRVGSSNF